MARKLRIEYAGVTYHVMSRGNRGRDVYRDERDHKLANEYGMQQAVEV